MIAFFAAAALLAAPMDAKAAGAAQPGRDPALLHRHVEQLQVAKEKEQETTLRKLLALGGPADEQAEVLARLANLLRGRALQLTTQAQLANDDDPQRGAMKARAQTVRGEAIARYRELYKKYPNAPRLDEALFFLADSLQENGDEKGAVAAARELTRRFPKSVWAPDAHVFVGEQLFEAAQLAAALAEYRAAAEVSSAEVFPYALYKAAWCRFNQKEFVDGMHLLRQVVQVSEARAGHADDGNDPNAKVQLVREARRDYVIFYSHAGKAEGAWAGFSQLFGEQPALRMLSNYAELLDREGRDPDAQVVYARLLTLHGDGSAQAALDHARLLALAARGGKRKELLHEVDAFALALPKAVATEAASATKPTSDDVIDPKAAALTEAQRLGEEQLRTLAVALHAEARKTQQEETYGAARSIYTHYLALFPKAEAAYELRFFAAELHYELGAKPEAAALYEAVVKQDLLAVKSRSKPGKRLVDAAWGAVLARDEAAGGGQLAHAAKDQAQAAGSEAAQMRPLVESEKALKAACELYLAALPEGPKSVEVSYRLGRLQIRDRQFDEAVKRLSWIALVHPESELAEYAANLTLDVANLQKDFPALHSWAVRFLQHGKLVQKHPALEGALKRVEEESAYAIAEGNKDDGAQAKALLDFASAHADGQLTDKALFGAAAALSRAGRIDEAIAARERLATEQPSSPLVPRALLASAADRAVVGDFLEAAVLGERYAAAWRKQHDTLKWRREHPSTTKRPPLPQQYDGEKARLALHDAAVLREARGEFQKALADRQAALKLWPSGEGADEDAFAVALLRGKLGEPSAAAKELAGLAHDAHGKPELQLRAFREAAHFYARVHKQDEATWAWTSIERIYARLDKKQRDAIDGAAEAAAEAHLELGRKAFDEFAKQQIKAPLQQTLARKVALLKKVKKRDEETVAMRQAGPAVCALAQLGEAQLLLSQAIEHSPTPPGLHGEQRKLYRAALEEQWKPIRDGAEETLRDAEQKSREMGIGNSHCADRARSVLGRLGTTPAPQQELPLPAVEKPTPAFVTTDGAPAARRSSKQEGKAIDALRERAHGPAAPARTAQIGESASKAE